MSEVNVERQRDLSELKSRCEMMSDAGLKLLVELLKNRRTLEILFTLRPIAEWHEDLGTALFWTLPVQEPPTICQNPIDEFGEGFFTHWSPLPDPRFMTATDGTEVHN